MDDAKLSCDKDSVLEVDANYLPLFCPAAAIGRLKVIG